MGGHVQGQRVNNFRIVRVLGEGSTGVVYEAEHTLIHRKVAVKVLKPGLALDADVVQRLLNEARATSAIRHPNIVEIVDVGVLSDGVPFLVMELLQGESLATRLDRVPELGLELALDVVHQVAKALDAAHACGIVHRDLKPDNVFLARDPHLPEREVVKVLDFGVAKLRPDLAAVPVHSVAGALFGTPTYMSPEQCRGLSDTLDQRADIYALGVILYEALCGRPPFLADNIGDMILQHMHMPPPPPSHYNAALPVAIEAVMLKALAKQPEERFASMAEFSAALGRPLVRFSLPPLESLGPLSEEQRASLPPAALKRVSPLPSPLLPAGAPLAVQRARPLWGFMAGFTLVSLLAAGFVWLTPGPAPSTTARSREPDHARGAADQPATSVGAVEARGSARAQNIEPRRGAAPSASVPAPERVTAQPPRAVAEHSQATTSRARPSDHRPARSTRNAAGQSAVAPAATSTAAVTSAESAAAPTAAAPAPGFLSLDSEPWSEVFLGSTSLGATPLMHVPLPPGKHVLTLKNSEIGRSTSYPVEIKSGSSVSRLVGWAQ
jgi:serine/threonine-protein kinase